MFRLPITITGNAWLVRPILIVPSISEECQFNQNAEIQIIRVISDSKVSSMLPVKYSDTFNTDIVFRFNFMILTGDIVF